MPQVRPQGGEKTTVFSSGQLPGGVYGPAEAAQRGEGEEG